MIGAIHSAIFATAVMPPKTTGAVMRTRMIAVHCGDTSKVPIMTPEMALA